MRYLFFLLFLVLLYPGQIVTNLQTGQKAKILRVDPTEVIVQVKCHREYWTKEQLKEWYKK